ncbi:MAG TPA: NUDIX domain-containing protein [Taishania sp.]|nr:NUDIX domain-containing protein [Taishania sp.]
MENKRFNIRIYGILLNDNQEILISDECRNGYPFTKFPGGGLEWGEGIKDCLKREFYEELGIDVTVGELLYCTDFFIQSAFKNTDQLISIYYWVHYSDSNKLQFESYTVPLTSDSEKFRWIPLYSLTEEMFTFPIDKLVARQLIKSF